MRGQLRIYMGAAPGVGKTFAMLNEGWRRNSRGTDVVVAYVETHGREATEAQIHDLEVVPRRILQYRGQDFEEMDLDAVLSRKPKLALVDELAHTNVPGSRHEKRWQDVEELLAAGIDVLSTVNVQHLESLNDVVQRITGVSQRETVPDAVVRAADQIELIDMSPEALRRRMAHGHIYAAEKVDAALGHYFRLGNLGALRELALLWVADRVDEGLQDYRERHGLAEPWETRERVIVALTGAPGGERLIRRGARLAARSHAELVGVHVRSADGLAGPSQELLEQRRGLLEEMGGRFVEITGADVADALVRFAVSENATQLLLGSSQQSTWAEITRGSVINRVIRAAAGGPIDVHVISGGSSEGDGKSKAEGPARSGGHRRRRPSLHSHRSTVAAWVLALVGVPLAAAGLLVARDAVGVPGMLLLLLLVPIGVALLGGVRPALAASVLAFLMGDWFYFQPTNSFRLDFARDAVALAVFVGVAGLVSGLVDRLARRSAELVERRAEAETLAALATTAAVFDHEALHRLVRELTAALDIDAAAVLVPMDGGWRVEASSGEPVPMTADGATYSAELGGGSRLVVVGSPLAAEDRRLLGAFESQLRLAQSTLRLQAEAASAAGLAEANNVRDAILAAVSHDLRGPLANIKAAATSLLSDDVEWPRETVLSFCKTIDEEVDRLGGLVSNLLDMTRLQSGMVGVRLEPVSIDEVVYAALASLSVSQSGVEVLLPEGLPSARGDRALLERALANVIGNAVSWAPEGTRVRVQACSVGGTVEVGVVDQGAGIPPAERDNVFLPFQRLGDGGRANHDGIGLGLAVTKGFVTAMGGEVAVEDTPGGGTTMVITLPVAEPGAVAVSRILVVDDDPRIRRTLEINLRARGYDVDLAGSGEQALQLAARHHPDAVILDLGLPAMDGLDVVRGLRGWSPVPIVVLSGRGSEAAKVEALDLGADDYLTKPFGMDELFARLRAAVRRTVPPDGQAVVTTPDFTIDFPARQARRDGSVVRLTPTQWHIVEVLVRNARRMVTYEQLLREVWGPTYGKETNYLRVFMTQIRHKLEPDPPHPRYFVTEPGIGFRFEPGDDG